MSSKPSTVTVHILDKSYQVSCPPDQKDELKQAAHYLDEQMRTIRAKGRVIGLERIAVMAALNIAYELLHGEAAGGDGNGVTLKDIRTLTRHIDRALVDLRQLSI